LKKLFRQLATPLLAMPRIAKRGVVLGLDCAFCALTVWLAFYLRLGEFIPIAGTAQWTPVVAIFASLFFGIPIFIISGLYRAIFRYNGLPALVAVSKAMFIYGLLYTLVLVLG
jgi:FlaA1/EpsC-like NDP-sugar epimerase